MPKGRAASETVRRNAVEAVRNGLTVREAARQFGVGPQAVSDWCAPDRTDGDQAADPPNRRAAPAEPSALSGAVKGADATRRRAAGPPRPADPITSEREYADEERVFLTACEAFRQGHGRRYLNACDYLHILKSLGYSRP